MIGSIIQPPDLTNSHTVNAPLEKGRHSNIHAPGAHLPEVREVVLGSGCLAPGAPSTICAVHHEMRPI